MWFCLSVIQWFSDFVRTIKPKRLKIDKLGTDSPSRYLINLLILGQKVKVLGHRVTKCKSIAAIAATILEQPRSTARLFLSLPPIVVYPLQQTIIRAMLSGGYYKSDWRLLELFCTILCTAGYSIICTFIWTVITVEVGPVGLDLISFRVCFCVFS